MTFDIWLAISQNWNFYFFPKYGTWHVNHMAICIPNFVMTLWIELELHAFYGSERYQIRPFWMWPLTLKRLYQLFWWRYHSNFLWTYCHKIDESFLKFSRKNNAFLRNHKLKVKGQGQIFDLTSEKKVPEYLCSPI